MRPALLLLAAMPLMAQPKLLVNAKVDTRSAAAGLEREFKALLTAQPQPAWIGYTVPAVRGGVTHRFVRDGVRSFARRGNRHEQDLNRMD